MIFDPSQNIYALVTSTTYGSWLHGEKRGFVGKLPNGEIHNIYGTPIDADMSDLYERDRNSLKTPPVQFVKEDAETMLAVWFETVELFHWTLYAVAVMSNHFHITVSGPKNIISKETGVITPVSLNKTSFLRYFKANASRVLNERYGEKRRWWTDSGSVRFSFDEATFQSRILYVLNQEHPLLVWKNPNCTAN